MLKKQPSFQLHRVILLDMKQFTAVVGRQRTAETVTTDSLQDIRTSCALQDQQFN